MYNFWLSLISQSLLRLMQKLKEGGGKKSSSGAYQGERGKV